MAANPPFRGVNWSSGIELALRLVTVMIVVSAAGNSLGAEERRNIRSLVAAHAYWLGRYSSLYSSANNHRVAEGLGLLVAGLLIPDLVRQPELSAVRHPAAADDRPRRDGTYKARPARVFRLDEIQDAHRLMESNAANGKIVVRL